MKRIGEELQKEIGKDIKGYQELLHKLRDIHGVLSSLMEGTPKGRDRSFTIDFMGIGRLVVIILGLLYTRGTPIFWVMLYFLVKEIKFWIKLKRR